MNFQQLKHFLENSKKISLSVTLMYHKNGNKIVYLVWCTHCVKTQFFVQKTIFINFQFFPHFFKFVNFMEFVNFSNLFNLSKIIDLWHENSNYSLCQITIFWTKVCILTYCVVMWRWHMNNLRITGFQAKKEKTLESTPDGLLASSFASSLPYNVLS